MLIKKTSILNLNDDWKLSSKSIDINLSVDTAKFTVQDPNMDSKLLRSVLDALSTRRPVGEATLTVISGTDLGNFIRDEVNT